MLLRLGIIPAEIARLLPVTGIAYTFVQFRWQEYGGGGGDDNDEDASAGRSFREASVAASPGFQGFCSACAEDDDAVQRGGLEGCQVS